MEDIKKYWEDFLELINDEGEYTAITLLKGSLFLEDDDRFNIICSGEFAAKHIKNDFLPRIKEFISERVGYDVDINVLVDNNLVSESIDNISIVEEESNRENIETNIVNTKLENNRDKTNLKKEYSFDNFIQGNNNNFVFAASKLVASNPGREHNPFYIYGSVGIGKTHLLQAIGNYYLANKPDAKILYIDGSGFRDEYIYGLQIKKPELFKKKYKNLDMLLLDDLQLLESAQETSKELFEIFQALDSACKQMVFVSDKPPKELRNIEARLKNRFEKSLILSIEPPQYETRLAIIERKIYDLNTSIDRDVMSYIAENITTDVRKIEGALKAYLSVRDILKITPDVEQCEKMEIFKDYFTSKPKLKNATVKEIKRIVSDYYGIEVSALSSKNRSKFIAKARHVAMYLSCEYSKKSVTEIGLEFNRDHSSIIHGRDKVKEEIATGSRINSELNEIISAIS